MAEAEPPGGWPGLRKYRLLLSSGRIGDLLTPNRMVMSPMTRFRVTTEGVPTPANIQYYAQRAGAGLIVSESIYVSPMGRGGPRSAGIVTDDQIKGWRAVTEGVHSAGGRMFAQLGHSGRGTHPDLLPGRVLPIAPGPVPRTKSIRLAELVEDGEPRVIYGDPVTPRVLATAEIPGVIAEYRQATRNAFSAGFDGVELHAGSGGLPHQFLATCVNQRTDSYGGSPENRCRFVLEVLEAMSDVRGSRKVGIKIAPNWCYNDIEATAEEIIETYSYLAAELSRLDLAYVHVQYPPWGMFTEPRAELSIDLVRKHYRGTLIGAGEFTRESAEESLARGRCDFVAFGRRYIANPDLVERFRRDAHENTPDESRFFTPEAEGFTDFKTLDEEAAAPPATG